MLDFIQVTFTEQEVEELKKSVEIKNDLLGYNNLNRSVDTRWVGTACEIAFKLLLEKYKIPFVYHARKDRIDDRDFTIGENELDVKGVATSYDPKPYYACNVANLQWQRIMKSGNIINGFIFARFNLSSNTVFLLGYISKAGLKEKAQFFEKGTQRGKIILNTDLWEVSINDLIPMQKAFSI